MAKYKAKEKLPRSNSFCGLDIEVWEKLNEGESVDIKDVPAVAKPYLEASKTKGKPKKETK